MYFAHAMITSWLNPTLHLPLEPWRVVGLLVQNQISTEVAEPVTSFGIAGVEKWSPLSRNQTNQTWRLSEPSSASRSWLSKLKREGLLTAEPEISPIKSCADDDDDDDDDVQGRVEKALV